MSPPVGRPATGLAIPPGTITSCANVAREARHTCTSMNFPTVPEQVGLRHPSMSASPELTLFHYPVHDHHLQPYLANTLSTPILPQFLPVRPNSPTFPEFRYSCSPPVQFSTPQTIANELAWTNVSSVLPFLHGLPSTAELSLQSPETMPVSHPKPSYSYSTLISMAIIQRHHTRCQL